ncbi:MAG: sugar ABC transporter ATP-binding protein [Verrucomicrobia bacterium]|nr:sugar ABC transporter ATP-binding protein [Verrucomicrobiota bacterium]MBV8486251.1 sugar ABC transporter ATP-binding protein [Verrucomicrobiota bacterium]
MPSFHLVDITKEYGTIRVLDQARISVRRGEVVALMGANGAGKSTLAKIAAGVVEPDHGRVFVGGKEVRLNSPRVARQHGIVIVHQSTNELGAPGLSVAENLVLDDLCAGTFGAVTGKRKIEQRAKTVAAGIGLELDLEQDFGELGPAHRQLVAIARAVAAKAAILILDEPTASLSAAEAARLFSVVDRLRSLGVGILYISHRLEDIRRVADRIVVLRNGQIVANQVRPLDLTVAIKAMIGRDLHSISREHNVSASGNPVLTLSRVRLVPGASKFDLAVALGEVLAITGALGSGKSRLLGAVFGLTQIAEGEIRLLNRPWRPRGPQEAIAAGVFMAGEDRWRSSLLPPITPGADIAGTIALPHRRRWFPFGFVDQSREQVAAEQAIRTLGIRCRSGRDTLNLLSGGNQQKVVIARWQAAPYQLLLLDEPFQGVDVGARRDLIWAIREARPNSATLVATSDVEEALEVADVVAVMRNHAVARLYDLRTGDAASFLTAISAVERDETWESDGGLV